MKEGMKTLEQLKGKNPFRMPEGYLEDFTHRMSDQLPERTFEEPVKVSWRAKVLPWIYLAAAIAGLGLFFNVLSNDKEKSASDSYIATMSDQSVSSYESEDSDDYLDYLETQYANYLLAEEMGKLE